MIARLVVALAVASFVLWLFGFALEHAGLLVVLAVGAGSYALFRRRADG